LFGVYGHAQAAALTRLGLFAQQHRGQESAGMCTTAPGRPIVRHAAMGLVNEAFDEHDLQRLANPIAIGHVRYSTTGSSCDSNAQPLLFNYAGGQVAIAHNGNLVNAATLRREYEAEGHIFLTSCDTEVITHVLARSSSPHSVQPIRSLLSRLRGAYSLLLLFNDEMVAVRDPLGFRPLCLGRLGDGAHVVASETCALDIVDAEYLRDVQPGEIIRFGPGGMRSDFIVGHDPQRAAQCIFEQIYFADPASNIFGQNVHAVRVALGRQLAREAPADGDLVIPVPNCARCAGIGYSQESGIPLERGFTTNHYLGRSFILPDQQRRDLAVRLKLNVIKETVRGRKLIVVEDSVVRGTTTRGKMGALRAAGAREIHLRVASPPIRYGCYFGIDFPDRAELVATNRSVEEVRSFLQVESLAYLSQHGMLSCVLGGQDRFCTACFSGNYPVPVDEPVGRDALERHQLRLFDT
jgi:amidophosphoribosyltransferase